MLKHIYECLRSFRRAKWQLFVVAIFCSSFTSQGLLAKDSELPFKVGFITVGPVTDNGFNFAHNKARLYLEKEMPGQIQTTIVEKVPESAECERVLERLIGQGNKLIFTTSYGFLEPALRVASRHPDVDFMQINRFQTAPNLSTYFSHQYQPMYFAGMVAGHMTKTNKLGFVGAHPVPPLLQAVNAFTMGARSVNPKVTTQVIWINNWTDPALEADAIKSLYETHCDVIAHAQDNQNTVLPTCERLGVYSCGFYTDGHELAPKGWLTGPCLEWGPFYKKIVQSVRDGKWHAQVYTQGMEGGYIKLATFGKAVPPAVQKEVLAKVKDLEDGKFTIFAGPLKDKDGVLRYKEGEKPDVKKLGEMNFFVDGVQGTLAKK